MSIFDRWRTVTAIADVSRETEEPAARRPAAGARFDVGPDDIDPALFGLPSWDTAWSGPAPKISRTLAMQVPGVKRARDIICQTVGGLPVEFIDDANVVHAHPLLTQPENDVPRSNSMINTLDDLLMEGVAVWRIVATDAGGYPTKVRRLEPTTVDLQRDNKVYVKPDGSPQGTAWTWVPDSQIIRFYSPTDPLLVAGARAIRTALALDTSASRYADDPMAQGYFRPTDGADPLVDEQAIGETDEEYAAREGNAIQALVLNWKRARQSSSTGYVPAGLEFVTIEWDPAQLQLAEGRQHAVLEIARVTGIDPEDLGVSTTSRTYANSTQKREELRDYTLNPFAQAITDRLSMPDITPAGWRARVNFRSFIEADEKTRMETYVAARAAGAYGPDEVQRREQLPAKPVDPPAAATVEPAAVPSAAAGRPLRVVNSAEPLHTTFAAEPPAVVGFADAQGLGFTVDVEARTIFGLVVPYGSTSSLNRGVRYSFARGTLQLPADQSRVKLRMGHERGTEVAYAMEFTDSPEGMWGRFKVARGPEGDRALQLAADKVWDGLSVGLRTESTFDYSTNPATAINAIVAEVSLTPDPSFTDSRVHAVTASNHDREEPVMPPTVPPVTDAPPPAPPADVSRETTPVTFSAAELTDAIIAGFAGLAPAQRPVIMGNPHNGGAALQVNEPAPYRFDGLRGEAVFSTDLRDALQFNNADAAQRLDRFMELAGPQFNVTVANAATINPNTSAAGPVRRPARLRVPDVGRR
jgi:HK97 family phage portal protein